MPKRKIEWGSNEHINQVLNEITTKEMNEHMKKKSDTDFAKQLNSIYGGPKGGLGPSGKPKTVKGNMGD